MYRVYNHSQNTTERLPLSHTHHTHTHTPQKHLFDVPTALLYDTQHTNARPKHTRTTHFFTLLIFTHTTDVFTYVKNEKKQHTQHTARTFTHARQTPHLFTHTIGRGGIPKKNWREPKQGQNPDFSFSPINLFLSTCLCAQEKVQKIRVTPHVQNVPSSGNAGAKEEISLVSLQ